jgi:ribosome-associated protein
VAAKKRTETTKVGRGSSSAAGPKRRVKSKVAASSKDEARAAGPDNRTDKSRAAANRDAAARAAALKAVVINALDDMKALEIKVLDVRGLTDVADTMVIASGTSDRHVRSVAQKLVEKTKAAGFRPHGVEGQQDSDWVLIDLNEMIVHVMLPRVREFYGLEKLWDMTTTKRAARA